MRSGSSYAVDTRDIDALAVWLDRRFRIPGTSLRFGLDSVVGLVPAVGDAVTASLGLYIVGRAATLGASPWLLLRMLFNVGVDTILGAIPIIGDLFDFAFKANIKNVDLLQRHLEKRRAAMSGT